MRTRSPESPLSPSTNNIVDAMRREKRMDLYKKTISFIKIRVDLDLASFKEDIWSH